MPISTCRRSRPALRSRCRTLRGDPFGAGARAQVTDEHDDAAALALDCAHRFLDERAGLLAADAEEVGERIDGVHAHEHRSRLGRVALDEREVLDVLDRRLEHVQVEVAGENARRAYLRDLPDDALGAQPVGDEVVDGADLEAMARGERHQIRQPRHGAVVIHDLADDGGG